MRVSLFKLTTIDSITHVTAIKSASKRSHTAEHCWKYNHDFDWEHKNMLKNWKTRTIKEAIYSEGNKHHINGIPSNYQMFGNQCYENTK